MTSSIADTGLNQLELGVCVGAWVGIFALFSIIDVTGATTARLLRIRPGLISHALIAATAESLPVQMTFTALFWLADKLPTLISVAILCTALYFAFIKRAMLVGGVVSTLKKLTRRR